MSGKTKATKPGTSRQYRTNPLAYPVALLLLAVALAFPFGLMVFDPTLMFERGWEQYVGTSIYIFAVLTLMVELVRLWRDEAPFRQAMKMLEVPETIADDDQRILPAQLRTLSAHAAERVPAVQLMEVNREARGSTRSTCRAVHAHSLHPLPPAGDRLHRHGRGHFQGADEHQQGPADGQGPGRVLDNLTGVTSALQIAFDSTLLALFLSAALMLVQTLVFRRVEDMLARVDRWVVEHVLPRLGTMGAAADPAMALAEPLERLRAEIAAQSERTSAALEILAGRLGDGLGAHVDRFATAIDRLPDATLAMERERRLSGGLARRDRCWRM